MIPSEQDFWAGYQAGQYTLDAVVERYKSYVRRTAHRLAERTNYTLFEDMAQEGLIAVVDLVSQFDPALNVSFLTFATRRIYGAMLDCLRHNDHVPRIERQREKSGLVTPRRLQSLQERVYDNDNRTVSQQDILPDHRGPLLQWEDYEAFDYLLRGLNETEQTILVMTFWDGATQAEVAEAVGLSSSRISQKMAQLLEFLKLREEARHGCQTRDGPVADGAPDGKTDYQRADGARGSLVA